MQIALVCRNAAPRALALLLSALIFVQTGLQAAPAPANPAAPAAPAPTASTTKEPLIEVSVDSLEITETNEDALGMLWGLEDVSNNQTVFHEGQLHFIERSVPSIFNVGQLNRAQIAARLDALIRNNQARVLANPTLLTKSGFEATFSVGGEIPYPTVGQGGVAGVEFKKYGVTLKILPQITPRKTIDAQINVGVSNPDNSVAITISGTSVPGLASREAGTKVEVNDGETVVLAGIKQSVRSKEIIRVPLLGYIPLIGLLFRHKAESVRQISLVLFVTFRFVKDRQAQATQS